MVTRSLSVKEVVETVVSTPFARLEDDLDGAGKGVRRMSMRCGDTSVAMSVEFSK